MKRVFKYFFVAFAAAAMVLSCTKDKGGEAGDGGNGGNGGEGGNGGNDNPPEVVVTKDYYVSVDGAGKKDGTSSDNAYSLAQIREIIATALEDSAEQPEGEGGDPVAPVYNGLELIDGYTVHFADGTYITAPSETDLDGLVLALPGAEKQIELTFEGSKNAILSGGGKTRVMVLGDQVKLTINGMSVQNAHHDTESGGAIKVSASEGGAHLVLNKTVFDKNWVEPGAESGKSKCSGAALMCAKGKIDATECVFEPDNYARNGGAIYTDKADAVVNFNNCTFKSHTYNTGGAANNSKGTQNFTACRFEGCYTEAGTGGAIHMNAADAVINIKDCVFKDCRAFVNELDKDTPNNNKASGIISMQVGEMNIDGTVFEGCYSSAGAVILLQKSDAGLLKCTNTVFKNNKGRSRGLVQLNDKQVAFFNNCAFIGNNMATSDWGMVLHGGNPSAGCFNNCTVYGNTRINDAGSAVSGGNAVGLNNDGSIILTNSTYIGSDDKASIRNTNANTTAILVANSVVINNSDVKNFVDADNMKAPFYAYSSVMGQSYTLPGVSDFETNSCVLNADSATLGFQLDATKNTCTWSGSVPDGFVKMTPAAFEANLKSVTVNNGNTVINGPLGTAFYNWLVEIGAVGKDASGAARPDAGWTPGAIEI